MPAEVRPVDLWSMNVQLAIDEGKLHRHESKQSTYYVLVLRRLLDKNILSIVWTCAVDRKHDCENTSLRHHKRVRKHARRKYDHNIQAKVPRATSITSVTNAMRIEGVFLTHTKQETMYAHRKKNARFRRIFGISLAYHRFTRRISPLETHLAITNNVAHPHASFLYTKAAVFLYRFGIFLFSRMRKFTKSRMRKLLCPIFAIIDELDALGWKMCLHDT